MKLKIKTKQLRIIIKKQQLKELLGMELEEKTSQSIK